MRVGLLIIGSEVLSGRTQDKNVGALAQVLAPHGVTLGRVVVIKDDLDQMVREMRQLMDEFAWTFVSGGLGPTLDDLTKNALGRLCGRPAIENAEARNLAVGHYARIGRTWTTATNAYHMIPEGVVPLYNPAGLAPGLLWRQRQRTLFCLPGVPREFSAMAEEVALPLLLADPECGPAPFAHLTLRTFGVPEEKIFFELCPGLWRELEAHGEVSSLPYGIGVDIVLKLPHREVARTERQVARLPALQNLLPHIWQWGDLSPAEYLYRLCQQKGVTLSAAESCTGGLLSQKLTALPGCSDFFLGSVISYSNQAKSKLLGVPAGLIQRFGAVSPLVAGAMASGANQKFCSDWAVSTTGVAGPDGGSEQKPVGTVYIGIARSGGRPQFRQYQFRGDRATLQERFAERALLDLARAIEGL